jgi:TatA/E family protein of Tat protein translocase
MFGSIGGPELLLILVLALIVFGPRKLPEIGKSLGRMMAEFRKASTEFRRTIEDEVELEKRRDEAAKPATPALPASPAAAPGTNGGLAPGTEAVEPSLAPGVTPAAETVARDVEPVTPAEPIQPK